MATENTKSVRQKLDSPETQSLILAMCNGNEKRAAEVTDGAFLQLSLHKTVEAKARTHWGKFLQILQTYAPTNVDIARDLLIRSLVQKKEDSEPFMCFMFINGIMKSIMRNPDRVHVKQPFVIYQDESFTFIRRTLPSGEIFEDVEHEVDIDAMGQRKIRAACVSYRVDDVWARMVVPGKSIANARANAKREEMWDINETKMVQNHVFRRLYPFLPLDAATQGALESTFSALEKDFKPSEAFEDEADVEIEDGEPQAARKRGRPRKPAAAPAEEEQEQEEEQEEEQPPKKAIAKKPAVQKRAKPAPKPVEEEEQEQEQEEQEDNSPDGDIEFD